MKRLEQRPELVALGSVVIGVCLVLGKVVVGILTGSLGILSEAVHSFLDLAASGFYVGCHPGMSQGDLDYVIDRLHAFPWPDRRRR